MAKEKNKDVTESWWVAIFLGFCLCVLLFTQIQRTDKIDKRNKTKTDTTAVKTKSIKREVIEQLIISN